MRGHWKDIERAGAPAGLRIEVQEPAPERLTIEVAPRDHYRIRQGERRLAWYLFDMSQYDLIWLRGAAPLEVIPPIRSRDEPPGTWDDDSWWRAWLRHFAQALLTEPGSPLAPGSWGLTTPTGGLGPYVESAPGRPERLPDALDPARAFARNFTYGVRSVHPRGAIGMRDPSPPEDGRVKMWRKRARERRLPPLLLYYLLPFEGYLLLDGHDRLAAALTEGVTPPVVCLYSFTEGPARSEAEKEHMWEMLCRAPLKTQGDVDAINAALIATFGEPRIRVLTRVSALRSGVVEWRREALEAAERLGVDPELVEELRHVSRILSA